MSLAIFALVLFQAAAATPGATPTPTPTPTPTASGIVRPRTLQDVARERRLKTGSDAKGTGTTITLGPGPGATPVSTPSASPPAAAEAPAGDAPNASDVRVVAVSNDGVVDPIGLVRVSGTVRNGGDQTVCGVVILVKILDSKGEYLASTQIAPDVNVLPARETSSFHASIQAPPGVRGARVDPSRKDASDGSTTMAGDWHLLGGTEAKVVDASACPK